MLIHARARMVREEFRVHANADVLFCPLQFARRRRILMMALGTSLALGLGCDRNIEPFQPGEEPSPPDLAEIFPAPPATAGGGEAATGSGAASGARSGLVARQALPPSRAESAAGARPASGRAAPIEGIIDIAPELASARPAGGVLFVIARPQGARGGPPLAVLRIPDPSFPLAFTIGPENVMIPSMKFAGSISISARLDADGNAMTRGAEDVSSSIHQELQPGAKGVALMLSEKG